MITEAFKLFMEGSVVQSILSPNGVLEQDILLPFSAYTSLSSDTTKERVGSIPLPKAHR